MSNQIRFTYDSKDYVLEFTRKSVEAMERNGFVANDIREKPMLTLPALFAGAFKAHHPFVQQKVIDAIFDKITNRAELIGKLAEMYNEPILALVNDPEESEGNVVWTAE